MKNKTISFKEWPSSGSLDAHLAKTLIASISGTDNSFN